MRHDFVLAPLLVFLPVLVLALATPSLAQERKEPTAFDLPPLGMWGAPGVRARFGETIARLQQRLKANAGDVDAVVKLWKVADTLGRSQLLAAVARKALKEELEDSDRARIRGVLGLALVARANALGSRFGGIIIIINGRLQPQQGRQLGDDQKKLFAEAEAYLRAAIVNDARSARLREALAETIEALAGQEEPVKEATKLRNQAGVIRAMRASAMPDESAHAEQAARLVDEAGTLERREEEPDHTRALALRKKALVLSYCADSIPFDFSEVLYQPVSLLAPTDHVNQYLTRTFTTKKGNVEFVGPRIHTLPFKRKRDLIARLGKDGTNGADAILVALVRGAPDCRRRKETEESQTAPRPWLP